jgi:sulfur-oxidizing protein SoxY
MNLSRRRLLEGGLALLAALGLPVTFWRPLRAASPATSTEVATEKATEEATEEEATEKAGLAAAFAATRADEALRRLYGDTLVSPSAAVTLIVPLMVDNGASVPVEVATTLAGVRAIALVVDKNPRPLAALFELTEGTPPAIGCRIKLGETSTVRAVLQTDAGLFGAAADVTVTVGGCA